MRAADDERVTIDKAVEVADVTAVRELVREYGQHLRTHPAGPEHFCVAGMERELEELAERYAAPGCMLLAKVEGVAAGCVALKKLGTPAGALELKRLWVRPQFRGIGLGRRLVEAAVERARAVGAAAICLDTVPAAMPEANRLYLALGFRQAEPHNDTRVPGIGFFRLDLR